MKSVDDCIVLGSLLDHFFNLVVMSNFLPSGMSKLSLKGRGQFHRELQNVCCSKKKSRFHVKWYKVFCFGFGLVCFFFFWLFVFVLFFSYHVQTRNLLYLSLVRNWIYTFLMITDLKTSAVQKKLAQILFCFTFWLL